MLSWKFTMTMMIGIGTSIIIIIIIIITFSLAVNNEATMLLHNIKYQCWDLRNVDLYRCMILGRDDTVTCRTAHTIQSFVPSWIRKENQIIAWEEGTIIGWETDRTTRRSVDQGGRQIWQEGQDFMNRDERVFMRYHFFDDDLLLSTPTTVATPSGEFSVRRRQQWLPAETSLV